MGNISIYSIFKSIPPLVRAFLLRALVFFVIWQLIYQLVLKPERYLDKYVTRITANTTAYIITAFYKPADIISEPPKDILLINGKKIIGIADGCNALELFILYFAFLVCMPASNKRRFIFAIIGITSIFILNVLRCCGIAWLNMNHPQYTDFAHHYVFSIIVYAFIFYMLTLFSQVLKKNNQQLIINN